MNQLETQLTIWAICSILLFELLLIICLCRYCFNRIKPKRFYVKREEYEYLQGVDGTSPQFQPTILRPPHADELALVGTIREPNPTISYDNGTQNFGYYRDEDNDDDDEDDKIISHVPPIQSTQFSSSRHPHWIELRPPIINGVINTAQLPPADYEISSYPTDDFIYTHQSVPPHPTIVDFRPYRHEYNDDNDNRFKDNDDNDDDDDDDELINFRFHSLRRPEQVSSHIQRTDTSTESFGGNYSTVVPKSILKSGTSATPPLDLFPTSYSQTLRSRTSSKFDDSPRMSVKINTDESIPVDYPTSAIEKMIPIDSIKSNVSTSLSSSSTNRMRFASVSQLNEIEWEVPREFQTVIYDLTENRQPLRGALIYSSNENLNNNNNNNYTYFNTNNNEKSSYRQRSQSAGVDQRTHVSRIFVSWDHKKKIVQPLYLSNDIEQNDATQQQAFEY